MIRLATTLAALSLLVVGALVTPAQERVTPAKSKGGKPPRWPEGKATAPAVLANVVTALVRSADDEELRSEDIHQLRFAGLLR